jgi:hypothetical protein
MNIPGLEQDLTIFVNFDGKRLVLGFVLTNVWSKRLPPNVCRKKIFAIHMNSKFFNFTFVF